MRLKFIKGLETKLYTEREEIFAIYKRICTTVMSAELFTAGAEVYADGGIYKLEKESDFAFKMVVVGGVDDSEPIRTIKHPQMTPFWKRLKQIFTRPKLSKEAMEELKFCDHENGYCRLLTK